MVQAWQTYDYKNRINFPTFDANRWSGSYPDGIEASLTYADGPRIVLFHSDGSNVRSGFDIAWGETEAEETTTVEPPAKQLSRSFDSV